MILRLANLEEVLVQRPLCAAGLQHQPVTFFLGETPDLFLRGDEIREQLARFTDCGL